MADAIRHAAAAASASSFDYEVIVVDDGSTDSTAEIDAGFARNDRRVRLILHASNRGYRVAVRSGIQTARRPWLLRTDADLQFDLIELESFVPTNGADLIVGWRVQWGAAPGVLDGTSGLSWARRTGARFDLTLTKSVQSASTRST